MGVNFLELFLALVLQILDNAITIRGSDTMRVSVAPLLADIASTPQTTGINKELICMKYDVNTERVNSLPLNAFEQQTQMLKGERRRVLISTRASLAHTPKEEKMNSSVSKAKREKASRRVAFHAIFLAGLLMIGDGAHNQGRAAEAELGPAARWDPHRGAD